jgi:S-DNA-T family DNA segregation ATPase FtsK/SpoIIIE
MLEQCIAEMERRYQLFKTCGAKDIQSYRHKTGAPLPTWWIIHDEFADWMQTDEYREQVPDLVNRLGIKARGAGIFLIFAAQRPDKDVMPMQLRAQLGNRLILRVDNAGTSEIAMGERNAGAERLLGKGHLLAKTGASPDLVPVQVPYISEQTFPDLVRLITAHHAPPP